MVLPMLSLIAFSAAAVLQCAFHACILPTVASADVPAAAQITARFRSWSRYPAQKSCQIR